MNNYNILQECTGFEWDQSNSQKNWEKYKVTPAECEQVFFNQPLVVIEDIKYSQSEKRFYALGRTDLQMKLFIVFIIRNSLIRVISARNINKKEKKGYGKYGEK